MPGTAPGQWRPTPPDYSVAWGPNWGQVTPFAIPSTQQFLPPPPPALNSPAYAAALKMTESLGAENSTTRTPQRDADRRFLGLRRRGHGAPAGPSTTRSSRMSRSSSTTHSTRTPGSSPWWTWPWATRGSSPGTRSTPTTRWRPITAIRDANQDGNPATVADPNWTPLGSPGDGVRANFTPNFPSYVSGHAAFGAALFTTLADFYGTNKMTFTIGSDEEPGVY